jgi:hypothetical protein
MTLAANKAPMVAIKYLIFNIFYPINRLQSIN